MGNHRHGHGAHHGDDGHDHDEPGRGGHGHDRHNNDRHDHDRHDHDRHDHAGHSHVSVTTDRRWLSIALVVIAAFMAAEIAVGAIANSLALISDASHMLTDAAAIVLALVAMRIAARPASSRYTFGLKRAEILSAQVNGMSLLLLAGWLGYEAVGRLISPREVTGWMVIVTGLTGLAVNVVAAWAISKANRASLNIEGAYQHVLMDTLASVAAAVAGAVVLLTGFQQADPIATLFVVALMVKGGWALVLDSARVLLNAAPSGMDTRAIAERLLTVTQVLEVHDLHVWSIGSDQPALSAHVMVAPAADCHAVRMELESMLAERYGITHATLQVDHIDETLLGKHRGEGVDGHCVNSHGPSVRRPVNEP